MMMLFNAFSFNMVEGDGTLKYQQVTAEQAAEKLKAGFTSCVGHQDTANLLTNILGMDVAFNRVSNALKPGDAFIVAQYKGPRLPEGATSLPEGSRIVFFDCKIE